MIIYHKKNLPTQLLKELPGCLQNFDQMSDAVRLQLDACVLTEGLRAPGKTREPCNIICHVRMRFPASDCPLTIAGR
jgi:hypothetical protein